MARKPDWKIKATDTNGIEREIAVAWETNSKDICTGSLDIENTGEKIRITMYRQPAKPAARPGVAQIDRPAA